METAGFVVGGYLLTRRGIQGEHYATTDLTPSTLISMSSDIGTVALEFWWNDDNVAAAAEFGVPAKRHAELIRWYIDRFGAELGAPGVAFSVAVLREFVAEFVSDSEGLEIVGGGVTVDDRVRLLAGYPRSDNMGVHGAVMLLARNEPLAPDGEALGFEPLSFEYGLEHSWLCNALEQVCAETLDVRPDPYTGLIRSLADARRVTDLVDGDDTLAEPGMWAPWLLVRYPLA